MARQFRTFLCATTILAGFALCNAVQAGPNGPNLPNLSPKMSSPAMGSVSSMRLDLSMRAPNALRSQDLARSRESAPRKRESKSGKPSGHKQSIASRRGGTSAGTGALARSALPKVSPGGSNTPGLPSGPNFPVPEIVQAGPGGPIGKNIPEDLAAGLLSAAPDIFGGGHEPADPTGKLPFGRSGPHDQNKPGSWDPLNPPFGSARSGTGLDDPSGKAADGYGGSTQRRNRDGSTTYHEWGETDNGYYYDTTTTIWPEGSNSESSAQRDRYVDANGHETVYLREDDGTGVRTRIYKDGVLLSDTTRSGSGGGSENPPDSTPNETGGRYTGPVWCGFGGCRPSDFNAGPDRPGPGGDPGPMGPDGLPVSTADISTHSGPGPGAATDPCPDCGGQGGGGGNGKPRHPGSDVGWRPDTGGMVGRDNNPVTPTVPGVSGAGGAGPGVPGGPEPQ